MNEKTTERNIIIRIKVWSTFNDVGTNLTPFIFLTVQEKNEWTSVCDITYTKWPISCSSVSLCSKNFPNKKQKVQGRKVAPYERIANAISKNLRFSLLKYRYPCFFLLLTSVVSDSMMIPREVIWIHCFFFLLF